VIAVEDVRVCRFCGHIDPVNTTGRCQNCGLFSRFALASPTEAEQFTRQWRRRVALRRLARLLVVLALLGGVAAWAVRVFFDLGLDPPRATTRLSVHLEPHAWAQERRTPHNSGFTSDAAPFPHQVAWTYRTSQPLLASPAVVEQHVYLATADSRILALDRHTGQLVWAYQSNGPSSSTPAIAGDAVICAIRPGRVLSLHRQTGEQQWATDLKHAIVASPVVMQGTVFIGSADRNLYALDAAPGQQRWAFTTEGWIAAAVAYADERVLVTSQSSHIHVIGADSGHERFVYDTGLGRHIMAGLAIQDDRAYFGSIDGRVWAIAWQTTTYPLERALLFWQTNLYIWGMRSQPPVQKGSVWSRRLGGTIKHTPAIAHNMVYITTSQGNVVALDATTGATQWQTTLGVAITAAPTVAGDTVLIGTADGVVFGLDAHTGKTRWDFKTAGRIAASPIVVDNTMYVVSDDGVLYAIARAE
jgi:outer membrane protein assembly factor BamB